MIKVSKSRVLPRVLLFFSIILVLQYITQQYSVLVLLVDITPYSIE